VGQLVIGDHVQRAPRDPRPSDPGVGDPLLERQAIAAKLEQAADQGQAALDAQAGRA
jgi:hypothetical protein